MKIFFLLLTTLCSFLTVCGQSPKERLKASLEELLKTQKVQAGIALIIDGEDTLALHNEVHYPMMSVFKFHQALAVADCLQRQGISLDTTLCIRKEELKENTYSSAARPVSGRKCRTVGSRPAHLYPAMERQQCLRHPLRPDYRNKGNRGIYPLTGNRRLPDYSQRRRHAP